jgi:acetyltransferase-like isoleucine patch superfamily enzyme
VTAARIHPTALVASRSIGDGTRIWAFVNILEGARIGRDCNICDCCFVENDVIVGDRVTIKCGVSLWDGVRLEDDVFVGPNVAFTNDPRPRSRVYPEAFEQTIVRRGASLGAGAVLLSNLEIGEYALVAAGAVVTRTVPAHGLVVRNPARLIGHVCRCGRKLDFEDENARCPCGRVFRRASRSEIREIS